MSAAGFYVTGTDTGVGKTLASAALVHALRAAHGRGVGMKPVASGCERTADGWRNADALILQAASDPRPGYSDVNPYALPRATAPQLASRAGNIVIELESILAAHSRLAALGTPVVVEGVGGWMAPLGDGLDQADLVRALGLPVVLVVGLRLGCLSHARLTLRAIDADGCQCTGWIASASNPEFEEGDAYLALLRDALQAPWLGTLPHASMPDPERMAAQLALPSLRQDV
jgi:dethiobiotin synthetase